MMMQRLKMTKTYAFIYLSVALTIPFMMPIKETINPKIESVEQTHGYFGVGNAFRI